MSLVSCMNPRSYKGFHNSLTASIGLTSVSYLSTFTGCGENSRSVASKVSLLLSLCYQYLHGKNLNLGRDKYRQLAELRHIPHFVSHLCKTLDIRDHEDMAKSPLHPSHVKCSY